MVVPDRMEKRAHTPSPQFNPARSYASPRPMNRATTPLRRTPPATGPAPCYFQQLPVLRKNPSLLFPTSSLFRHNRENTQQTSETERQYSPENPTFRPKKHFPPCSSLFRANNREPRARRFPAPTHTDGRQKAGIFRRAHRARHRHAQLELRHTNSQNPMIIAARSPESPTGHLPGQHPFVRSRAARATAPFPNPHPLAKGARDSCIRPHRRARAASQPLPRRAAMGLNREGPARP